MDEPLCQIEIFKNGTLFIARSQANGGPSKEYKNHVLEDMLTELVVDLQEDIE
jgi:hypothetical protein